MYKSIPLLIFTCFWLFAGCDKTGYTDTTVDTFVEQLKKGSYNALELPDFSPEDIPALLQYRNDTTTITDFPHNPISSLWLPECRLGIYVLWTIESIRTVETESEFLIGRFPSQNPLLGFKDQNELALIDPDMAHMEAAQAYYTWWYSDLSENEKMETNPLEETNYKWY